MKHLDDIIKVIAIVLVTLQFKTCFTKTQISNNKADTITVIKTLPAKQNEFVKTDLKPVIIQQQNNSKELIKLIAHLEDKYNKTADNNTLLRELLQARQKRIYKETFKDSIQNAEVTAYTTGKLDSIRFKYETLPIQIKETTINNYITPDFRILAGADLSVNKDLKTVLGVSLGLQTKKGHIYSLGVTTDKQIKGEIKLNIFEKY